MREILFRGKTKNSEWVEGSYVDAYEATYIFEKDIIQHFQEVIPETVGQYTGLTDKNGTKIFEGDIAKFNRFESDYVGKIVFNDKTAGFELWWNVMAGAYGEKATYKANLSVCDKLEVVCNIHDNPELLKGGADNA